MKIYLSPKYWTQRTTGEKDRQTLDADGVATLADVANFESVRGTSSSGLGGGCADGDGNTIKSEVKTAAEVFPAA